MPQRFEPPGFRRIPVSAPDLSGNEEAYLVAAVRSGWVSSTGEFLDRFEREFAAACGTRHAVACSSGTTALHLALATLDAGRGDEVIVPATTFVATANAVRFCNATPVFVDVDPETWCLDPRGVAAAVGPRTVGIIPVHLLGHPADMDAINAIAEQHGLWVVEDAAEATFATYRGRPVGSLADAAAFSFFGNKIVTSGEGGAVTFSRDDLATRMRMLRGHGMDPARRYHFPIVGFNYRMSNLTAALACAQLERREALIARRRAILRLYDEQLRLQPGLSHRADAPWAEVSPWLFAVVVDRDAFGLDRDALAAVLAARGIETRPVFPPLHRMPPYRRFAARQGITVLPVAERLGADGLMLPTHPLMTDDDVAFVCEAIAAAGRGHVRRRTA
jgi:perosamine synthetase